MIRNHRPRGFAWTCASLFQETPAFRHIDVEDCEADADDVSQSDVEDNFAPSVRAAKRRRIAGLADDFLNGKPLPIYTATFVPEEIRYAVARSFAVKKYAWRAFDEFEHHDHPDDIWEDVLDDREILQSFLVSNHRVEEETIIEMDYGVEPVVTEGQAQASCGPKRRLRSAKAVVGPSDDALQQAAALRNRRLQVSATVSFAESQPQSCPRPCIPETQTQPSFAETLETASDCGPSPTPAWTSSKWIKSGAFEVQRRRVDEECSRDELGASFFTPSQRTRARPRPFARANKSATASFDAVAIGTATTGIDTSSAINILEAVHDNGVNTSIAGNPICARIGESSAATRMDDHTALEDRGRSDIAQNAVTSFYDNDSQTQLRRRQGVHGTGRTSWMTINEVTELSEDISNATNGHLSRGFAAQPKIGTAKEQTKQKPPKCRKARSTGDTISQPAARRSSHRRLAPLESQKTAEPTAELFANPRHRMGPAKLEYISVAANNGASPFIFRKRASRDNKCDDRNLDPKHDHEQPPRSRKTPRTKVVFPTLDDLGAVPNSVESSVAVADATTHPQTPLINEHLNTVLPRDSSRRSSLRHALREELRASGAELSRCSVDSSSQPNPAEDGKIAARLDDEEENCAPVGPAAESQPRAWPGTQILLAQAHRDLFTSPDKSNSALYLGEKTTPQIENTGKPSRGPLKPLSQDCMPIPSTQALWDGWQGWSSVKKPRGPRPLNVSVSVHTGSPTLGKRSSSTTASDPVQSLSAAERKRSSLRYSLSFSESPDRPQIDSMLSLPVRETASQPSRVDSSTCFGPTMGTDIRSPASHPSSKSTTDLTTRVNETQQDPFITTNCSLSSSLGNSMSNFQHAQNSALADYNSQDLSQVITELVTDLLDTGEIDGLSSGF